MKCSGRIHKFGDHIDTDVIIPATLLGKSDPESLARGCFSAVYPGFSERVSPGDLLFAGENFGCGSSREHAPLAIKATGIGCVVAASFSRIFYRSAINVGLPIAICPAAVAKAQDGEQASVDFVAGAVTVAGESFAFPAFPPEIVGILESGGLVGFMEKRLKAERAAAIKLS
jgi:3-isopropylmalate/(R)-2-methylmalate dehydratase small subunit